MALVIDMVGCTTWTATHAPLGEMEGKRVRVTAKEIGRIEGRLRESDSLGFVLLHRDYQKPRDIAVDTSAIALVEQRHVSTGRTLGLIIPLAIFIGSYIAIGIAVNNSWGTWGS